MMFEKSVGNDRAAKPFSKAPWI